MKGIRYLVDEKQEKVAVQIDLKKYGQLWEDFYDAIVAEARKGEETISWKELKRELKNEGKLPDD